MGEALIPFYAMLDTRNAIWCPRSVWRRRNSMSEDGRMMLERVHACDETCYFIHKLGWDEEVCTGCLKSRFRKSFRHLSLLNILFIAFNLRIDVRFFFFQHSVYITTAKLKTRESSSLRREWFRWFQYEVGTCWKNMDWKTEWTEQIPWCFIMKSKRVWATV